MNLRLDQVSFTYPSGVHALRKVQLEFQGGERVAILGENGAGKTTLAKHFNGLLRPSTGRVLHDETDTKDFSVAQLSRRVGFVFQNPDEQLFQRTVLKEIQFGPSNLGFRGKTLEELSNRALEMVDLRDKSDAHPFDLLPAERKLLGLASVLSMDTPILILDEPTLGLDRHGTEQLIKVIDAYAHPDRTIMIITHDLDFCVEHFNRFVILSQGKIVADTDFMGAFQDEELLSATGLEPPQLVQLSSALGWSQPVPTIMAFLRNWQDHSQKGLST